MKNIVICCDGTGNEISENISNVLKLYRMLRKTPKTTPHQVAFYDPGVGTLARPDPFRRLKQKVVPQFDSESRVVGLSEVAGPTPCTRLEVGQLSGRRCLP